MCVVYSIALLRCDVLAVCGREGGQGVVRSGEVFEDQSYSVEVLLF